MWVPVEIDVIAFFDQIINFSTKLALAYQKLFCLVALLVSEQYFHFGSDTSDYI